MITQIKKKKNVKNSKFRNCLGLGCSRIFFSIDGERFCPKCEKERIKERDLLKKAKKQQER